MTMGGNNGGGPFNGTPPNPGNANVGAGNAAALRAAMQQVAQNAGNASSTSQAGNIAMQGVTGINGLNGLNAKPLITELTKLLKQQATLIENMNKHGASAGHIQTEENKFKNFEAALIALKAQQKSAMMSGTQFDPNFINNLANIANIFKNPAVQRVAANIAAAANNPNQGNNQGSNPTPPGTPPPPPTAGNNGNNWLGSFFSAFNTAFRNFFGGTNPFAGGNGGGRPPVPPIPGAPNPGGPGNPNQMAAFMAELARLRAVSEEYRNKQKGYIQSNLTKDDLKDVKNAVTGALQGLLQDPSLSNDDKALALNKFNGSISKFESAYKEQAAATKNFVSMASGIITTLQLGQLATKMYLSDPFQYQTMPAINAIGSTGKMGEVAAAGISGRESWELEQNQTGFGIGSAIAGAGFFKGGKAGLITGGLGAIGALGSLAGGGSAMRDIIGKITGTTTSESINQNLTAEKLMNPQTLADKGTMSRGLYTAFGGNPFMDQNKAAGADFTNLGNYMNGAISGLTPGSKKYQTASGNAYIDKFWRMGMDGTGGKNALSLGMDADQSGAYLANMAGSLRGKTMNQSMNLANYALKMGTGLGVDPNSYASTFQGMQSVGMNDLKKGYNESLSVFADAKGEVSQFSANVLQPALMKVTTSLAMRNVSMSADKLSENVNAFQKYLSSDLKDSELSKRAAADPNVAGGIINGFADSTAKFSKSTAGVFASYNLLGMNPYDLQRAKTDPKTMMKTMENVIGRMNLTKDMFQEVDGKIQVKNKYATQLDQIGSGLFGQELPVFEKLIGSMVLGKGSPSETLDAITANMARDGKAVEAAAGRKTGNIANTPESEVLANMAKSATDFGKNVQAISGKIQELQLKVDNYVSSSKFLTDAEAGITRILNEAEKLMNQGNNATAPSVAAQSVTSVEKDKFKGIMGADGRSSTLLALDKVVQRGTSTRADKEEATRLINSLMSQAKKAGNTDFSSLLQKNNTTLGYDILGSAKNIIGAAGSTAGAIAPQIPSGTTLQKNVATVDSNPQTMLKAIGSNLGKLPEVDWTKAATVGKGTEGTTVGNNLLASLRVNGDLSGNINNLRGTVDSTEDKWMQKNLGMGLHTGELSDAQETKILNAAFNKTRDRLSKDPGNKGLQGGLAMINSVKNMAGGQQKEDLVKMLALVLANTHDAVNISTAILGSKGRAISATGHTLSGEAKDWGLDAGKSPTYSAPTTPVPTPGKAKAAPTANGNPKAPTIVAAATGADQVTITIDGQGAVQATRRYIDNQINTVGQSRKQG